MPNHDKIDSFYSQTDSYRRTNEITEEEIVRHAVIRLNGHIVGFVLGTIGAMLIFLATNWLVLKGGDVVGPHLGLLGQYFYGYSVTFVGSLIGAAYLFFAGYFSGLFISWIYNWVVSLTNKELDR